MISSADHKGAKCRLGDNGHHYDWPRLCGGLGALFGRENLQNELTKMQESSVEHSENILKLSNLNSEMLNIRQEVSDLNELLGAL